MIAPGRTVHRLAPGAGCVAKQPRSTLGQGACLVPQVFAEAARQRGPTPFGGASTIVLGRLVITKGRYSQ